MATVQIIWCREKRALVPTPSATFPTTTDANAAAKRYKATNPDLATKTYDVIAVTV
jgi:hypothetical protein